MRHRFIIGVFVAICTSVVGCDPSEPTGDPVRTASAKTDEKAEQPKPKLKSKLSRDEPAKPEEKAEQPKPDQPILKPKTFSHGFLGGKVTKIGPDGFEIGAGWTGHLEATEKYVECGEKAVWIITTGTRVGGDPNGLGHPSDDTYRLVDLKVGDMVSVHTGVTRAGEQYCSEVFIRRRPGGKIPPPPPGAGDKSALGGPVFFLAKIEEYQAAQDWEEKGVPIPKKFLDKDGRYPWAKPPYPPEAPVPHEPKPKP